LTICEIRIILEQDEVKKMAYSSMNVLVDEDVQKQATRVFEELGVDMNDAIDMFLRQSVIQHGIPFTETSKPEHTQRKSAKLGGWEGKIWMADDFDAPLDDFKEYME
jgi:addiction module RelB/DinJ family antitoxin